MQILGTDWQQLCKQLSGHRWVGYSKKELSETVFLFLNCAALQTIELNWLALFSFRCVLVIVQLLVLQ